MRTSRFIKAAGVLLSCLLAFNLTACSSDDDDDDVVQPKLTITEADGTTVQSDLNFPAGEGTKELLISSNGEWTVTKKGEADWLTITPAKGSKDGAITLDVAKNTKTEDREATVGFNLNGKEIKTVKIKQLAFGPKISVTPENPEAVSEEGGKVVLTVTTNADKWEFEIKDKPSWIKQTKDANKVTLAIEANPEKEARTATAIFKLVDYPAIKQEVKITQNAELVRVIKLESPKDKATIDLETAKEIEFKWTSENIEKGYKLILSSKEDLSKEDFAAELNEKTFKLPADQVDAALKEAGVGLGKEATFYWSVQPKDKSEALKEKAAIFTLVVKRKTTEPEEPKVVADMLDIEFTKEGAKDLSPMKHKVEAIVNEDPFKLDFNKEYNRYIAKFVPKTNGQHIPKGSYFKVDYVNNKDFENKLAAGHTFECLVQFDVDYNEGTHSYETKFFSTHEQGGTGFLVARPDRGNGITFLPNVTTANKSTWIWTTSKTKPDGKSWYHLVGVWDKEAGKSYLYIDGKLAAEADAPGEYWPANINNNARWICLGGDAGNGIAQNAFQGSLGFARIYSKALTAEDAAYLWSKVKK